MEYTYVECDCTSGEHTIRFVLESDEVYPHIYVNMQLSHSRSFFKRLWLAVKYVFGYECKYGHWDETLLTADEVEKLRGLCDRHLEQWKKYSDEVQPLPEASDSNTVD